MPHHNQLKYGRSSDLDPQVLHMRHFWAARVQNWQQEMPDSWLERTRDDRDLLPIAEQLAKCPQPKTI